MESFWRLPGPGRFVRRIADAAESGRSVVIALPAHLPPGLREALRETFRGKRYWRDLQADNGDPGAAVRRMIGPVGGCRGTAVADLAAQAVLDDLLIWSDISGAGSWSEWRRFVPAYAEAVRNRDQDRRGVFLTCLRGRSRGELTEHDVALSVAVWADHFGHFDTLLYAARLLPVGTTSPAVRQLLATTIAHLAPGDPEAARVIAGSSPREILEPGAVLARIAEERGWNGTEPPCWARGTLVCEDGREFTHSALLPARRPAELRRRLWSAQVSVILPLIEQRKHAIIEKLRNVLTVPYETDTGTVERLAQLELRHISKQLDGATRVSPMLRREVQGLRGRRNDLAHLEPIEADWILESDLMRS